MNLPVEWSSGPATGEACTEYTTGANASFPNGWGDERLFHWAFLTPRAGRVAVLLTARQAGLAVAGSGVTFRVVACGGTQVLAAIMTGSWTRPDARGLGLFSTMIQRSISVARAAGADLLLGFATDHNASRRRLAEAGATMFPAAYCLGPLESATPSSALRPMPLPGRRRSAPEAATFVYTEAEWRHQFLDRPTHLPVEVLGDDSGTAVIELGTGQDRVHTVWAQDEVAFLTTLTAHATIRGRRVMCYTTRADRRDALVRAGFDVIPGSVATIATGNRSVDTLVRGWDLDNGDRL